MNTIECFGGGTHRLDNAPALKAALEYTNVVLFGPGVYNFSQGVTLTIPIGGSVQGSSVLLQGCGADVTILNWPNINGGLTLTYSDSLSSAHVRNMTLATGQSNGGTGLALNISNGTSNPANGPLSDITGVTLRGSDGYAMSNYWTTGILLSGVSNVNLMEINITGEGCSTYSTNGTGLEITGSSEATPVAFNISRATINYVGIGINIGPFVQGVLVTASNFTGDEQGVYAPPEMVVSNKSMLYINGGNQFNCSTAAVNVQSVVVGLQVLGNMIIVPGATNGIQTVVGVQIGLAGPFSVVNNQFVSAGGNGQNGIVIQGYYAGTGLISGNNFYALNPTTIWLQAGSQNVNVQSNAYAGSAAIQNHGAGNTIGNGSP